MPRNHDIPRRIGIYLGQETPVKWDDTQSIHSRKGSRDQPIAAVSQLETIGIMLVVSDRTAIIAAIDDYMGERINSAEFDERLSHLRESKDSTVRSIAKQLWFFYDDIIDHLIQGPKAVWDLLARYRLILASGGDIEIQTKSRRLWHISQLAAMSAALCLGATYLWFPLFLLPAWLASGLLSMFIAVWHRRWRFQDEQVPGPAVWPFSDIGSIRRALERTPGFRKPAIPSHIATRKDRSRFDNVVMQTQHRLLWIIGAPVLLLFQSLPLSSMTTKVSLPADAARQD